MKLTTKLLLGATVVVGLSVSAFAACASDVDFGSTDGTNGKNITGLKDPTEAQHAATKGYVDARTSSSPTIALTCDNAVHNLPYRNKILLISRSGARTAGILNTHHNTKISVELSFSSSYSIQTAESDAALADVNLTSNRPLGLTVSNSSNIGYKCLSGRVVSLKVLL